MLSVIKKQIVYSVTKMGEIPERVVYLGGRKTKKL